MSEDTDNLNEKIDWLMRRVREDGAALHQCNILINNLERRVHALEHDQKTDAVSRIQEPFTGRQ